MFLTELSSWIKYQAKLNEKIHACSHFISGFECASYKKIQLPVFYFLNYYFAAAVVLRFSEEKSQKKAKTINFNAF